MLAARRRMLDGQIPPQLATAATRCRSKSARRVAESPARAASSSTFRRCDNSAICRSGEPKQNSRQRPAWGTRQGCDHRQPDRSPAVLAGVQRLELVSPTEAARIRGRSTTARTSNEHIDERDARSTPGSGGSSTTDRWPNAGSRCSDRQSRPDRTQIANERFLRRTLLAIAGVFAAVAAAIAFWPKPAPVRREETGRHGDDVKRSAHRVSSSPALSTSPRTDSARSSS